MERLLLNSARSVLTVMTSSDNFAALPVIGHSYSALSAAPVYTSRICYVSVTQLIVYYSLNAHLFALIAFHLLFAKLTVVYLHANQLC